MTRITCTFLALALAGQSCASDEVTTTVVKFEAAEYQCFAGPPVRKLLVELFIPGGSSSNCESCYGHDGNCTARRACVDLPEPRTIETIDDLAEITAELRFPDVELTQSVCLRAMTYASSYVECKVPEEAPTLCASTPESVSLSVDGVVPLKVSCKAGDVPCTEPFDLKCPTNQPAILIDACDTNAAPVHTCVEGDYVACTEPLSLVCPKGQSDPCDNGSSPVHRCEPNDPLVFCNKPLDLSCAQGLVDICATLPADAPGYGRHACVLADDTPYQRCIPF